MAKHGLKGVSLASRGVPATAETPFRIGSVSKLFTALEVVRLAEMGRVDLDRDIAEFVPGFAIRSRFKGARPITPRSLLAHHSGRMTAWPRSTREQPGGNLPWDIEIDHGASASVESILVRIARRVTGGGESGRQ